MRVVHLSTLHPALDVRIFEKECRTLAAHGFETHLLAGAPPSALRHGVHLHPLARPTTSFRPGRIWQRLSRAYCAARDLRGDVYHFHDPELITVGLALKRQGARVIYDVHEDTCQEALLLNQGRPLERQLKARALDLLEDVAKRQLDAFVCATPHIARKFPPRRTVLVQNFPLLGEFDTPTSVKPYGERPLHILYAGGITAVRGIREMVRALELLPERSGVQFVLLGEFFEPSLLQEMSVQPGWRRTRYLGWQPRARMAECLADARLGLVLYHPDASHLEAYPNKMFEYMAAGLPVVASDFPLWRQIIQETGGGLVADPLDPAAIAHAVDYLLTHPGEAQAMGRRGRAAVIGRYHWETEAQKLLTLYASFQEQRQAA
jgi:glycosyltransferase involved in cell wall biosynthesis